MAGKSFTFEGFEVNSVFIPCTSGNIDPSITPFLAGANGDRYPTYAGNQMSLPVQTASTPAIETATGICGFAGLSIAAGINLYYSQYDELAPAAGSVHFKAAVTDGIMLLDSVTASDTTPASADYRIFAISPDGSTAPLIFTQNVPLPSPGSLAELFFSGPLVLGGVTYQTNSIGLTSNWTVGHDIESGLPFPTRVQLEAGDPTFDIGLVDLSAQTAITALGSSEANTAIYFREGAPGGDGRTAAATLAHLKFASLSNIAMPGPINGNWREKATNTITIHPVSVAGADPVIITPDLAIPA